jgi:acyl-CoA dehydrogenase
MTTCIDLDTILAELAPKFANSAAEADASGAFADENYRALREARVFSALVPSAFGGGGAGHADMALFLRGLARACPSTALALSMHQHLVATATANDRAGRPGRKLLETVAAREAVLVSTGANDWLDSNGLADPCEGGWRVTATKPFASGAPAGDMVVTSARCAGAENAEVLHFAVPMDAEGVRLMRDWDAMGMRATGSDTLRLDGVFVPEASVVLRRPAGPFHPAISVVVAMALPLIMSVYTGIAEAAAEIARERAAERADDPVTALAIGRMLTRLTTGQLACDGLIRLARGGDVTPGAQLAADALTRKAICAEACIATVDAAMEAVGGAGFLRRTGLERLARDVQGARYHPLPGLSQQLFAGRHALGLPPVGAARAASSPAEAA